MAPQGVTRSKRGRGCLIAVCVFFGIGLFGAVVGTLNPPPPETEAEKAERIREEGDLATRGRGREAVRALLKDPSSAEFSDDFGRVKHGERVACGFINGRNSFGAMAGREPWLAMIDQGTVMIHSFSNERAFVRTWNKYCTGGDDRDDVRTG